MSVYTQANKQDRMKIHRQMIAQAQKLLPAHLKHTARTIVDMALAKERHEQNDSSNAQQSSSEQDGE